MMMHEHFCISSLCPEDSLEIVLDYIDEEGNEQKIANTFPETGSYLNVS